MALDDDVNPTACNFGDESNAAIIVTSTCASDATISINVQAPPPTTVAAAAQAELPRTGRHSGLLAGIGLGVGLMGAGLAIVARRRYT